MSRSDAFLLSLRIREDKKKSIKTSYQNLSAPRHSCARSSHCLHLPAGVQSASCLLIAKQRTHKTRCQSATPKQSKSNQHLFNQIDSQPDCEQDASYSTIPRTGGNHTACRTSVRSRQHRETTSKLEGKTMKHGGPVRHTPLFSPLPTPHSSYQSHPPVRSKTRYPYVSTNVQKYETVTYMSAACARLRRLQELS